MTEPAAPRTLRLERLPGEYGPTLRCWGDLTGENADLLREEIDRLGPIQHPVLTVDLTGCDFVDAGGMMVLLDAQRRLGFTGRRVSLVARTGTAGRLLHALGIDWMIPTFPSPESAALALRGGGPPRPAPATWADARRMTLDRWRAIEAILEDRPETALRMMTSMSALCELSEELFQDRSEAAHARCRFCPLFYALGGRPEDVGCRSILDPVIDAVESGNLAEARERVAAIIRTIETMTVPDEGPAHPAAARGAGDTPAGVGASPVGWGTENGDEEC